MAKQNRQKTMKPGCKLNRIMSPHIKEGLAVIYTEVRARESNVPNVLLTHAHKTQTHRQKSIEQGQCRYLFIFLGVWWNSTGSYLRVTLFKCQISRNMLLRLIWQSTQFTLLWGNTRNGQKVVEMGGLMIILCIKLYEGHMWKSVTSFLLYVKESGLCLYVVHHTQRSW